MKHTLIKKLQGAMFPEFVNGWTPRNTAKAKIERGTVLSDISYGTEYPNSFLDIYQCGPEENGKRPVFIYCHGGGYTWGDKVEGDPNAKEQSFAVFQSYLDAGYQVVSVNYALAPEYAYPVPLLQLNQCVNWLLTHCAEYHLDMDCVIFGGGSAGAHLAGQYVNLVTNETYAKQMKITPQLKAAQILAFVSSSGLLDCARFDRTDSAVFNFILRRCSRAYFGTKDFRKCEAVVESNVISHMTKNFPPCFLSDGNTGTFTDQAEDMAGKAEKLGVPFYLKLYPKEVAKLGHGFEGGNSVQAAEVMQLTIQFLKKINEDRKKICR